MDGQVNGWAKTENATATIVPPVELDAEAADESLWQNDEAVPISERERRISSGPNYPVIFWLALLHVGALTAPFFFSWEGIAMMFNWLEPPNSQPQTSHVLVFVRQLSKD